MVRATRTIAALDAPAVGATRQRVRAARVARGPSGEARVLGRRDLAVEPAPPSLTLRPRARERRARPPSRCRCVGARVDDRAAERMRARMSKRSMIAPLTRCRYASRDASVHVQAHPPVAPVRPQRHRFIAATSCVLHGYRAIQPARRMRTSRSSSGWRSASMRARPELGQLVQEQHAAVRERDLPDDRAGATATDERLLRDRVVRRAKRRARVELALAQAGGVVDGRDLERRRRASSGGRIVGRRCASIVLPQPGAPNSSRLWPPAAAAITSRRPRPPGRARRRGRRHARSVELRASPGSPARAATASRQVLDHLGEASRGDHARRRERGSARVARGHEELRRPRAQRGERRRRRRHRPRAARRRARARRGLRRRARASGSTLPERREDRDARSAGRAPAPDFGRSAGAMLTTTRRDPRCRCPSDARPHRTRSRVSIASDRAGR